MNNTANENLIEIKEPKYNTNVSNHQLLMGQYIPPIDRLKIISPDEFEEMIEEWIYGYLIPRYGKVEKVVRIGGAGDKGRDVIAYRKYSKDSTEAVWENYQCKHYNGPLAPSEMWVEFGKLCYYTFIGDYSVPKKYYLVAPQGIGGKLHDLIMKPDELRSELIKNWNKKCLDSITKTKQVPLEGEFKVYTENFDFSIIDSVTPAELIEQYQKTIYFPFRFGGGLQKIPDRQSQVPEEVSEKELLYIEKLFNAYSDHKKEEINNIDDLKKYPVLRKHFNRQRTYFYQAESLKVFERDTIPNGVGAFNDLKNEVFHGIVDVVYSEYEDGLERLKVTNQEARKLVIEGNILASFINGNDKSGICHHLANEEDLEEEITWVIKDDE
ncbi:restriction endonuclease [Bacillus inaquosorum]|uniref:ABC-three component system protein n=1 Tax=Bacillus inaquosorum TaxID=483913 RepID=UPI002281E711|nr:ABC-three component system protein [Bacillus inaquosorum]MCY8789786.1 restriction endonuclease [Bacillus inaquosorum]